MYTKFVEKYVMGKSPYCIYTFNKNHCFHDCVSDCSYECCDLESYKS